MCRRRWVASSVCFDRVVCEQLVSRSTSLVPCDGDVHYFPGFISRSEADSIFDELVKTLDWQTEELSLYGKRILVPRLVAWYGDRGAVYRYSGARHEPLPWSPLLLALRERVAGLVPCSFHSVLANYYRDGNDSMGWHADKEPELGINPVIASLSFGAARLFKLQHTKTKQVVDIVLEPGSLLLMRGSLQHHWRHCLPKTRQPVSGRVNLTFRRIIQLANM